MKCAHIISLIFSATLLTLMKIPRIVNMHEYVRSDCDGLNDAHCAAQFVIKYCTEHIKMAQASRRTKKTLNIEQKIEILTKLDKGTLGSVLAKEYGVADSTISYIKSKKSEILAAATNKNENRQKKNLRKPEYPEMEEKLYAWFLDQRARNCPINSLILKAKAKDFFAKLYPNRDLDSFHASDGWFQKFKHRVGIRFLKICGEKLDSDTAAVQPFINRLNAKIEEMGVTEEQIYNADETGLYYRLLPENTYVSSNEKSAAGHKKSKERLTAMLCANAAGTHKVKPLVIGKSRKPRCFKDFINPLDYDNSQNAWMTLKIFKNWFNTSFVRQVSKPCFVICSCSLFRSRLFYIFFIM